MARKNRQMQKGGVVDPEIIAKDKLATRDAEIENLLYTLNPARAYDALISQWTYSNIAAQGRAFIGIREVLLENLKREVAIQREMRELETGKRCRILETMRDAVQQRELQEKLASSDLMHLRLEYEAAKLQANIAECERRKRGAETIPPSASEQAREKRECRYNIDAEEKFAEARYQQRIMSDCKGLVFEIYADSVMGAPEKRTRILAILDAYAVEASILPSAVQEFLEEEGYPE